MVGKYKIEVSNNRVTFSLDIKRNITIIQGDSATGKSSLVRMIGEYNRAGDSSGIAVKCEKECIALISLDWEQEFISSSNRIFFLDENNRFIYTKRFAEIVNRSDNYFVLIVRDSLPQLAYSVDEIYGMRENRSSQKYIKAKHIYNELFKLYNVDKIEPIKPSVVITEDTNSGFDYFSAVFGKKCISSGGKSLISLKMVDYGTDGTYILVIVDGAAFGANMQEFIRAERGMHGRAVLFAPESFEYLILKSGILDIDKSITEETYKFADSSLYSSWEQFFTTYLIDISKDTIYHYKKNRLNKAYLTEGSLQKIKALIPELIEP